MRFDDRLTTVLKGPLPEGLAASLQWRQVADLLAQKPGKLVNDDVQAGFTRLRDLHDRVNEADRLAAVRALHGRLRSGPLLVYLCADSENIGEAAVEAADLSDDEWADLILGLPSQAKTVILKRSLGPASQKALGIAVSEDFLLLDQENELTDPPPVSEPETEQVFFKENTDSQPEDEENDGDSSQISTLVAKIADYHAIAAQKPQDCRSKISSIDPFLLNRWKQFSSKQTTVARSYGWRGLLPVPLLALRFPNRLLMMVRARMPMVQQLLDRGCRWKMHGCASAVRR